MNQKYYLFLAGGIILALAVGAVSGYNFGFNKGLTTGRAEVEQQYQEKIEEVFPSLPEPEEIFSVDGEVVGMEGETLYVEQSIDSVNPFEDLETKEWEVRIGEETEIVKLVERDPEEFVEEEDSEEPMEPFREVEIGLSEISEGQFVNVEAGENIKGKSSFTAQRIVLEFSPESPEMPE